MSIQRGIFFKLESVKKTVRSSGKKRTDMRFLKRIVSNYQVGEVLLERTPKSLAKTIKMVISKDYSHGIQKAKEEFIWEKEKEGLVALLNS